MSEGTEFSTDKWRDTVTALLARAMDERTPAAEREVCQQKADAIILKHKIDNIITPGAAQRRKPGSVVWKLDLPGEFYEEIRGILWIVADHCNLKMASTWSEATMVGFPEDLEFANMLWTTLLLELTRNMYPTWDPRATFDDNVYRFVKGGYKWALIHDAHKMADPEGAPEKLSGRYKAAYVRQCGVLGEEPQPHTQRHSAFRASYVMSFRSTIRNRLYEMRKRSRDEVVDDKDKFALAMVSTKDQVDEEFYRLFPQFRPAAQSAAQSEAYAAARAAEEERRAKMSQAERDREDRARERAEAAARRNYERLRDKRYDRNGWAAGTRVAENVDLSGGRGHVANPRNELEGS